jgi:hypothetical protein
VLLDHAWVVGIGELEGEALHENAVPLDGRGGRFRTLGQVVLEVAAECAPCTNFVTREVTVLVGSRVRIGQHDVRHHQNRQHPGE